MTAQTLWKALAHLFPAAVPNIAYRLREAGDGTVSIVEWNLPDPVPTEQQLIDAAAAYDAAAAQQQQEATALRQQVIGLAQSAVGVVITDLTAAQVRALAAILLWKAGALDKDGKIRPLGQWVG